MELQVKNASGAASGQVTVADEVSTEVPRRFARLQRKYGRWGLAYLESILRAADWSASAQPGIASKFRGDHEP